MHAALALIVTLLSLAGFYLMLYAPFVAGVQIVLYAGGIMVLFLFVIMLVNLEQNIREYQFNKQWLVGTIAALALGGLLLFVFRAGRGTFPSAFYQGYRGLEADNTQQIGSGAIWAVHVPVRDCFAAAAGGHRRRGGHGEKEDLKRQLSVARCQWVSLGECKVLI